MTFKRGPNIALQKHSIQPLERFGLWKALEPTFNGNSNERRWRVRCDCGTVSTVSVKALVSGLSKSCGCAKKNNKGLKSKLESAQRNLLKQEFGKICCECRVRKPLDEFYTSKHTGDGRMQDCKECSRLKNKVAYDKKYGGQPRRKGKPPVEYKPGHRFGTFTVIQEQNYRKHGVKRVFLVRCDCGLESDRVIDTLTRGRAKCLHNMSGKAKELYLAKEMAKKEKKTCRQCGVEKALINFRAKRLGSGLNRTTVRNNVCNACKSPSFKKNAIQAEQIAPSAQEKPPWAR